MMYFKLKYIFI